MLALLLPTVVLLLLPSLKVFAAEQEKPTAPRLHLALPESFRLLQDQRFDLRVEIAHLPASAPAALTLELDGVPWAKQAEVSSANDGDPSTADQQWTFRELSFAKAGRRQLKLRLQQNDLIISAERQIEVQAFAPVGKQRSLVLMVGDAMGTAYRDAGRILLKGADGGLRQGRYREMLAMDQMPVSGMVMTHSWNALTPDSTATASALMTGNKTINGATGVFPDSDDVLVKVGAEQATARLASNNPRVETLFEYLKRRHNYRTGVVTTSSITDATPSATYAHSISRKRHYDIARQLVDGGFGGGPGVDVVLGGGRSFFSARIKGLSEDQRDLEQEMKQRGYKLAHDRVQLEKAKLQAGDKILGLFAEDDMEPLLYKLGQKAKTSTSGAVAKDKALATAQPTLDNMVRAALTALQGAPFVLLVEGALIDKESHRNEGENVFYEVMEFDRAVEVVSKFRASQQQPLLQIVTADHDQTMTLLGVAIKDDAKTPQNVAASMVGPDVFADSGKERSVIEAMGYPTYQIDPASGYPRRDSERALMVGFRTAGHTASAVPVTADGPGALLFTGYMDQTDIFFKAALALGQSTDKLDQALRAITEDRRMVRPWPR